MQKKMEAAVTVQWHMFLIPFNVDIKFQLVVRVGRLISELQSIIDNHFGRSDGHEAMKHTENYLIKWKRRKTI
jgi:hypothetical protein